MTRLREVAAKIAAAKREREIVEVLADNCRWLFDADSLGIMVFDEARAVPKLDTVATPDRFVENYERELHGIDPLRKRVLDQQVAVRDLDVGTRDSWLAMPAYRELAVPCGLIRCMQGPVVGDGHVIGAISVGRRQDAEFSIEDLMTLSSLCAHVSVQLARLRSMPLALCRLRSVLTAREVEVSLLVAKGLTNVQIGHVLGVSVNAIKATLGRAFRKLQIESRVELVALLFDGL